MSRREESFKSAAAGANWRQRVYQMLTTQPGQAEWPITSATFILMHKAQDKPAQAQASLKFFEWAYKSGDQTASSLDYVPMPDNVKDVIFKSWGGIQDTAGEKSQPVVADGRPGPDQQGHHDGQQQAQRKQCCSMGHACKQTIRHAARQEGRAWRHRLHVLVRSRRQ